ncbi:MAG: hypothetical protein V7K26_17820 [Nostoc sp.]|uniref:hypothetical protein n=1 Tax=Nostoc sp. TaxID=1180 RepID=UPI002FF16C1D
MHDLYLDLVRLSANDTEWDNHNLTIPVDSKNRTQEVDYNTSCCLLSSILLLTVYLVVDAVDSMGQVWL